MELHQLEVTCLMDLGDLPLSDRVILAHHRRLVSLKPRMEPHLGQSLLMVENMDLLALDMDLHKHTVNNPMDLHNLMVNNPMDLHNPMVNNPMANNPMALQWTVILLLLHKINMHLLANMPHLRISMLHQAIMLLLQITTLLPKTSIHHKTSTWVMINITRTSTILSNFLQISMTILMVMRELCMENKALELETRAPIAREARLT